MEGAPAGQSEWDALYPSLGKAVGYVGSVDTNCESFDTRNGGRLLGEVVR